MQKDSYNKQAIIAATTASKNASADNSLEPPLEHSNFINIKYIATNIAKKSNAAYIASSNSYATKYGLLNIAVRYLQKNYSASDATDIYNDLEKMTYNQVRSKLLLLGIIK